MRDAPDIRGLDVGRHRMPCPECDHGPKDTALSVDVRADSSAVWICFRCGWKGGQRGERARLISVRVSAHAAPRPERNASVAFDHARSIWKATTPLAGTLGAKYLDRRCCVLPPADGDLRFDPALYCAELKTKTPALVARVSTVIGNRAVGVHRIWIRPGETKAIAKKRLGGGTNEPVCIRLWPDDAIEACLGIAEGIETALAAAHRLKPMWSTVDAGQMAKFPLLDGIESLTIFADYDNAGMMAATTTQERYFAAGRVAQIVRSRIPGEDFADVMLREAQR